MRELTRRDFMKVTGGGVALVSMAPWIQGCAGTAGAVKPAAGSAHATGFDAVGVDQGLLRRVLQRGLSRGGEFSEVFLQHTLEHWVGMEDGQINRAYVVVELGAGIRVLKGDATGFAYSEDLSEAALLNAAGTAAAVADTGAAAREIPPLSVTELKTRYPVPIPWSEVGIDQRLPLISKAEAVARRYDARIIKVTVFLQDETTRILVANSEGLLVEDDQPMGLLMVSCVAEKGGKTETSGQSRSARDGLAYWSDATLAQVANEAADYTVRLFGAAPPPVGDLPVVLAPGTSGILLHEAMGHGMEADFNRKGTSIYSSRIGQRVAPEFVTILDDGTGAIRGSINIDDEGTPAQRTVVVENGVLKTYLHDRISAAHYKVPRTGNGRRESFRFPPVPRMRNTYMLAGPHSPEEIIASVPKGLYAEMFSNGQVNIGAGEFTFYLKHGRRIENGKLGPVVKDANLIGSGPKVLEAVQMAGSDLKIESTGGACGKDGQRVPVGFGLPTLKVGAISIGGRES